MVGQGEGEETEVDLDWEVEPVLGRDESSQMEGRPLLGVNRRM